MIEPIGLLDNPVSPYERYSQYQQFRKPEGPLHQGALSKLAPEQAPPSGQALAPGQAVAPAQSSQADQASQDANAQKAPAAKAGAGIHAIEDRECQTCKNRKYQDQSDDPGVSYQTPTKIGPNQAASAVRSHEYEHVAREQGKAKQQGREVVSQSVVIKTAICPECGKVYISGGETTTVTRAAQGKDSMFQAGQPGESDIGGLFLDKNV